MLWENLPFPVDFPFNQSIDIGICRAFKHQHPERSQTRGHPLMSSASCMLSMRRSWLLCSQTFLAK